MYDDLTLLDDAASSDDPLTALVDGLPELLHVSYALVVGVADDGVVIAAASRRRARGVDARLAAGGRCRSQLDAAEVWDDPAAGGPDCELLAAPFRDGARCLLGRIGGPAFLPAELTRVAHLARVAQALLLKEARR